MNRDRVELLRMKMRCVFCLISQALSFCCPEHSQGLSKPKGKGVKMAKAPLCVFLSGLCVNCFHLKKISLCFRSQGIWDEGSIREDPRLGVSIGVQRAVFISNPLPQELAPSPHPAQWWLLPENPSWLQRVKIY